MGALEEFLTRKLLKEEQTPLVRGKFYTEPGTVNMEWSGFFIKAQIPGAKSRRERGLVKMASDRKQAEEILVSMLKSVRDENGSGVLITEAADIEKELYISVVLDFGSLYHDPGAVLLFSESGGSGIEERTSTLIKKNFSVLKPLTEEEIRSAINKKSTYPPALYTIIRNMISTFCKYKLLVIEANPVGILKDGSVKIIDCRAEYDDAALPEITEEKSLNINSETISEKKIDQINREDPAGTGFFRKIPGPFPPDAIKVAANLCGGGGKMLWEMAAGKREDIVTINESDTSGGLSAFKSCRIMKIILAQKEADVFVLTGSGMGFQNQYNIASALIKALRETENPLQCYIRFGGTDEKEAANLIKETKSILPVPVKVYAPEIFPDSIVEDILADTVTIYNQTEADKPVRREIRFSTDKPPAQFSFNSELCSECVSRPCISSCKENFLKMGEQGITGSENARCTGCLRCETACLVNGRGSMKIIL